MPRVFLCRARAGPRPNSLAVMTSGGNADTAKSGSIHVVTRRLRSFRILSRT